MYRSLFGDVGVRSFKIGVVCDSEALRRNRCLGMWECDRRFTQLEQYLSNYLIIPVDQSLCREWAYICAKRQSAGRPISPQDAWIAATALRYDLPLVTHNIKDFLDIPNLRLIIPL